METKIKWVSVEEALPENENEHKEYLISLKWYCDLFKDEGGWSELVRTAKFNNHKKLFLDSDDTLVEYDKDTKVTHWAEMPKAISLTN